MEIIDHKDRYSAYASIINEDQIKLISAVNTKQQEKSPDELNRVLSSLISDTVQNFSKEEISMKDLKYPEYHYHEEEHKNFSTTTHS